MPEARGTTSDPRALRERMRRRELVGGPIMVTGSAGAARLMGEAGFDWVTIDTEEATTSPFGPELAEQVRAVQDAGVPALARVTECRPEMLQAAVGAGVDGIWVPHLDGGAQAADLVAACAARPGAPAISVAIVESVLGLQNVKGIAV